MDEETPDLAELPDPTDDEIVDVAISVVADSPGISMRDATEAALELLGCDFDDTAVETRVQHTLDDLIQGRGGPLAITFPDRVTDVNAFTEEIVLTRVVSQLDSLEGTIDAGFDLGGFLRRQDLHLEDGRPVHVLTPGGKTTWFGPRGWLDQWPPGTALAFRVDRDGMVRIDALDSAPEPDPALVARLRAAYDEEVAEPWFPIAGEALVVKLLLEDPETFATPRAPLSDLATAAGLERRGDEVAHTESVWFMDQRTRRCFRILRRIDDPDVATKVLHIVDVADLVSGAPPEALPEIEGPVDTAMLRAVLADLRDPAVFAEVAEELVDLGASAERVDAFVDALLESATKGRDIATARLLAALQAESAAELDAAEQHLVLAHEAAPDMDDVTARLAWYASDRGDAARAVRLLRRLPPTPGRTADINGLEKFATGSHSRLGRNEPCWCGSGRKFKQCHMGQSEVAPLAKRAGWLWLKAMEFLQRGSPDGVGELLDVARALAGDRSDPESLYAALRDPLVTDLVLAEGGWFEAFLETRGSLLPDDEALLAESWLLVDRTVYEIVELRLGEGMSVRDLRTGDRVDVTERTGSGDAAVGELICARAVPDGESHIFLGGAFRVLPGTEEELLDDLDGAYPESIAAWAAATRRPPKIVTRAGEELVDCSLEIELGDTDGARAFLDMTYAPDDSVDAADSWAELFPINEDEEILRARLRLDGSRLIVSTNSEERADRILDVVRAALPDAKVVLDQREPMDAADMVLRRPQTIMSAENLPDDPEIMAEMARLRERIEERWCDESIPALGGLTPREAAADPTRRDALVRLIASFKASRQESNFLSQRPERLRELLGLD